MPSSSLYKQNASFDFKDDDSPTTTPITPVQDRSNICARLITTNKRGRREVINLTLDRPVTIGRDSQMCDYVVQDRVVSNVHCKLYAVLASTGAAIVSCQDFSTNGIYLNGHKLNKNAAIIMNGDSFELPHSQSFKCIHEVKETAEKANIFDPTPPQPTMHKNLKVGRYTIVSHCLGSGTFASVHLAFDSSGCKQVACKTVITKSKGRNDLQKVMKEVDILRGLHHPNINRVLDVEANEKNGWLHIFLELCTGGDLFTYISCQKRPVGRLCEGEAKYIMFQILKAIKYLHNRMISHRDLKPENVLLFSPGPYPRVQVADFGLARSKAYQETLNVCGTVAYLPPEGIRALDRKELGYVGMPADCWSAGVILYAMLAGGHPFDFCEPTDEKGETQRSDLSFLSQCSVISEQIIKKRIVNGTIDFYEDVWGSMPDAKQLVSRLLTYDHSSRETVYGALQSHWILSDLEELENAYKERIL